MMCMMYFFVILLHVVCACKSYFFPTFSCVSMLPVCLLPVFLSLFFKKITAQFEPKDYENKCCVERQ